jgi:hypothetical protein
MFQPFFGNPCNKFIPRTAPGKSGSDTVAAQSADHGGNINPFAARVNGYIPQAVKGIGPHKINLGGFIQRGV